MIGRSFSNYRITAKLGEGGMGEVYRASDSRLGREVAVKVLPEALAADPERLVRFEREARVLAALDHPSIAAIYGLEEAGDRQVLVMQLAEGETLAARVARGPLPLEEALGVVQQIAAALAAAHDKGVIHRDLKPANVMLAEDGRVRVLDFGLAKLSHESTPGGETAQVTHAETLTEEGMVLGTPAYMSPEQAQGKAVDGRSDLFSLGCILYEMATGVRPFQGESSVDTLHKIIYSEPEPLGERLAAGPPQLQWILRKALAKSPAERYQSAGDLAVDLRTLKKDLESDPNLAAVGASRVDPGGYVGGRRSGLKVGISVAALAAIAGLFWFLGRESAGPEIPEAARLSVGRITTQGNVIEAAISVDGKYIAYVEAEQGQQGLYLRQLEGGPVRELIPPSGAGYWGVVFSPDGTDLFYGEKSARFSTGAILRISTLGGAPTKIVEGTDSAPAFSPDGARMAWVRARHPSDEQSSLMVSDIDGSGARILSSVTHPERLAPIFFTAPSWSPDGRLIAAAVQRLGGEVGTRVVAFDVDSGKPGWTADHGWAFAGMVGWLPDGEGLVAIVQEKSRPEPQVWLVPYPQGSPRPITNDLLQYRIVSLAGDGESLLTVATENRSSISVMPSDGGERPRVISPGRLDGLFGFDLLPDGRIVFQSVEAGDLGLAIMAGDGSGRRRLTEDDDRNVYPQATPDGRIVYLAQTPLGAEVRIINADGSGRRRLAEASFRSRLAVSPDGSWVAYDVLHDGVKTIWRVPVEGGAPERLIDHHSFSPAYSPDGTRLGFYTLDDERGFGVEIAPFDGGPSIQRLENIGWHGFAFLRWAADGEALLISAMPDDRANLWRLPLDGGPRERLTDLSADRLVWSETAADGETRYVALATLSRDAVLIRGFR